VAVGYREATEPAPPMEIAHRWSQPFRGTGVLMLLWGLPWIAFGIFMATTRDGWRPSAPPWPFALLSVAIGAVALYLGAASLVNSTRVTISSSSITRRMGPLPWRPRAVRWSRLPEPRVDVREERRNDVRNGAFNVSPPKRYEVVLVGGNDTLVLFGRIVVRQDAEVVARVIRDALAERRP
jgi:hypothetical protein